MFSWNASLILILLDKQMEIFATKACLDGNVATSKPFIPRLPLFHRAPLPNSFVLNINYFPTTLEMLPAIDLPRSRKRVRNSSIYTPFQGLVGEIPMKKKEKKKNLLLRSILHTSFVDCTNSTSFPLVCNTERWTSGFLRLNFPRDTLQWIFPRIFVSSSNTYEINCVLKNG